MNDPAECVPSPEDEERVSRLLAEAGGPVTMPREVAGRLDGVLADLVAERTAARPDADVTPLRRRRRRGPALLLAAAAVVTGGFAVQSLLTDEAQVARTTVPEAGDTAGDTAGRAESRSEASASPEQEREPLTARTTPDRTLRLVPSLGPVLLRPGQLEADVLDALQAGRAHDVVPTPRAGGSPGSECAAPELAEGETWSPAEYDGAPAVLVAAEAQGGSIEATVLSCAGETLDEVAVDVP